MNMKNIGRALFIVLFIGLCLTGCGNQTSEKQNEQQVWLNEPVQYSEDVQEKNKEDNKQITQNESIPKENESIDYSKSYASVLDDYKNFAKDYNTEAMDNEKYMDEPWSNMQTVSVKSDGFGYAFKDLNGNGTDELLLLNKGIYYDNDDYFIGAIYSLTEDKPKLLDSFYDRYRCFIGKDGFIYTRGSNGAWNGILQKCTISPDGTCIKTIEEIETEPDEETDENIKDNNGEDLVKYYSIQADGKRVEVSEQKYSELRNCIPEDNKQSGLNFISLS